MDSIIPETTIKISKKNPRKYLPVPLQVHILEDTSLFLLSEFQKGDAYLKSKNIYIIIFLPQH